MFVKVADSSARYGNCFWWILGETSAKNGAVSATVEFWARLSRGQLKQFFPCDEGPYSWVLEGQAFSMPVFILGRIKETSSLTWNKGKLCWHPSLHFFHWDKALTCRVWQGQSLSLLSCSFFKHFQYKVLSNYKIFFQGNNAHWSLDTTCHRDGHFLLNALFFSYSKNTVLQNCSYQNHYIQWQYKAFILRVIIILILSV